MMLTVPCQVLIDQEIFIGDDPIGHCCRNPAMEHVVVWGKDFWVCQECAQCVKWSCEYLAIILSSDHPNRTKWPHSHARRVTFQRWGSRPHTIDGPEIPPMRVVFHPSFTAPPPVPPPTTGHTP